MISTPRLFVGVLRYGSDCHFTGPDGPWLSIKVTDIANTIVSKSILLYVVDHHVFEIYGYVMAEYSHAVVFTECFILLLNEYSFKIGVT